VFLREGVFARGLVEVTLETRVFGDNDPGMEPPARRTASLLA